MDSSWRGRPLLSHGKCIPSYIPVCQPSCAWSSARRLTLYTIFANIHSTSSTSTSTPCNSRASWNVDIGIRVDLSEAIQLIISSISKSSLDAISLSVVGSIPFSAVSNLVTSQYLTLFCVFVGSSLTLLTLTYAFLNKTLKHPSLALSTTK